MRHTPSALVIVNPHASRAPREQALAPLFHPLEQRGWSVSLEQTSAPGSATELARRYVAEGCSLVIAAGGDGTVNEVAQALVHTDAALGVIPLGMVNLWAHELEIPQQPAAAVRALAEGTVRHADLGVVDFGEYSRHFLLMAGIGFDAEVVRLTDARSKRVLGPLAFVLRGLLTATQFRPTRIVVKLPNRTVRKNASFLLIGNARSYAGDVSITPRAAVDDGLLDLCLFTGGGPLRLTQYAAELLLRRHLEDPGVLQVKTASLSVRTARPTPVQVDGELAGTTPVAIRVDPLALHVLVPAHLTAGLFSNCQTVGIA